MLASFPNAISDVSTVSYLSADPAYLRSGVTQEILGGLDSRSYSGKLAVSPGVTDPILWTRGSLYNLGYSGSLADRGASGQTLTYGTFWDAPRAWGNPGTIPRLPNTVILAVSDDGTVSAGIAAELAYFAAKNISVFLVGGGDPPLFLQSIMWVGIPTISASFATTDLGVVDDTPEELYATISTLATDSSLFRAGRVFVATQTDNFLTPSNDRVTYPGYCIASDWGNGGPDSSEPADVTGASKFTDPAFIGPDQYGGSYLYVFDDKIAADLATIASIVTTRYAGYINNCYFNTGDGTDTDAYLPFDDTSGTYWTDAADNINAMFAGPYFQSRPYAGDNDGALWDAIFADIVSFFGA